MKEELAFGEISFGKNKKGVITNEFGEKVQEEEIKKIAEQIQNFPLQKIDGFWFNCSWIDSEKDSNLSLPDWRLKKIKSDLNFAITSLENLFIETPKRKFLEEVRKLN